VSLLQAIVLGVVQGLTEFLPVSSSAHLILVPWLLGWEEPGLAFDAALHLGTLTAVFAFFWRDLLGMVLALPRALRRPVALLRDPRPEPDRDRCAAEAEADARARLALLIAVGCAPAFVAGLLGQGAIEGFFHAEDRRRLAVGVIAATMAALGVLLWVAERAAAHHRRLGHLTWRDAVGIGLAQTTALLPGVSRSGATLTAGLFAGLRRADAARFSFLLGSPITLAAGLKGVADALGEGMDGSEAAAFVAGGLTSAVVGYLAIGGLLRFLARTGTGVFVAYRLLVAAGLLVLLAVGFR
jgi:undecaprenyl-diphosphatase